jgi:hypothetical protein
LNDTDDEGDEEIEKLSESLWISPQKTEEIDAATTVGIQLARLD